MPNFSVGRIFSAWNKRKRKSFKRQTKKMKLTPRKVVSKKIRQVKRTIDWRGQENRWNQTVMRNLLNFQGERRRKSWTNLSVSAKSEEMLEVTNKGRVSTEEVRAEAKEKEKASRRKLKGKKTIPTTLVILRIHKIFDWYTNSVLKLVWYIYPWAQATS
mgnify:CR=1 FL=1